MANAAGENRAKPEPEQLMLKFQGLSWKAMRQIANQFTIKNVDLDDIEARRPEHERHARISSVVDLLFERNLVASWKKVVDVLNDVGQEALAKKVQRPETEISTQPTDTGSTLVPFHGEKMTSEPTEATEAIETTEATEAALVAEIKEMIVKLEKDFDDLKNLVRECLEKRKILIKRITNALTQLSPDEDDQHKNFFESHLSKIVQATNPYELFITMNLHWNYLNPPLLGHLVRKLELVEVKDEMKAYNLALEQFRRKAPLSVFCKAQKKRRTEIPSDFQEMVTVFDWPKNHTEITLEVVEKFREECAHYCNLHDCAMMVGKVCPGSFIVNWFIPKSIVEKIKLKVPREILKKYFITKLEVAGVCVYSSHQPQEVSATPSTSSGPASGAAVGATEQADVAGAMFSIDAPKQLSDSVSKITLNEQDHARYQKIHMDIPQDVPVDTLDSRPYSISEYMSEKNFPVTLSTMTEASSYMPENLCTSIQQASSEVLNSYVPIEFPLTFKFFLKLFQRQIHILINLIE